MAKRSERVCTLTVLTTTTDLAVNAGVKLDGAK